ncbi:helix-turn-helix domain-containing protein [Cellulomonas biazotea]|nr:helix-turn-helix transcriptional regulator [Cellulomonas biazotea]
MLAELAHQRRRAFGARLRAMREARGLTQEGFAHDVGLHRTYVGSVERGERNVSLDAIWRLAEGLGTTPAAFFER